MRADRMVAILLLLQTRGQVTAAEVAAELEVSERTARRDLDALGVAGLPVYSLRGRNGGWRLLGGGRTDLSGLSSEEVQALFLVAGPSSTVSPEVRAALRKLVRALPEPFRVPAEAASAAVVVDQGGWDRPAHPREAPPLLAAVQRAVVDGEQVVLGYVDRDGASTSRRVHPLGLAAKGSVWYLVAWTDAGQRTFRVDRVRSVEPMGEPVVRPAGFDLAEAWRLVVEDVDDRRTPHRVRALVDPGAVELCGWIFGSRFRLGPPGPDGRVEAEVRGFGLRSLAGELAGLGAMVEVVEPVEVRELLGRIGAELAAYYGTSG